MMKKPESEWIAEMKNSYFPHDIGARDDENCLYIIWRHGPVGYGLFWILVEMMHSTESGKLKCVLLPAIAQKYNLPPEQLEAIYKDMVEVGLLVTDGEFYWPRRVLSDKEEIDTRRTALSEAGKRGMTKRWGTQKPEPEKQEEKPGYNHPITIKEKKRKERKESKENNSAKNSDIILFGSAKNVRLTEEEHSRLLSEFPEAPAAIEFLSLYIQDRGDKSKAATHNATIRRWVITAVKEQNQRLSAGNGKSGQRKPANMGNFKQREYSDEDIEFLYADVSGLAEKESEEK